MTGASAWTSVALLVLAGVLTQSPDELLRRSDFGAFAPPSFRARLALRSPAQHTTHEIEVWRSGDERTLVRFLNPKERGKYLLRLGRDTWLLAPGAKKPVKLGPSYRLYGGATIEDILGTRLVASYDIDAVSQRSDAGGPLVVFTLRAKAESTTFRHVDYVVRESTGRPISATYRLRSGREATGVEFVEWNERGLPYVRRILVKDYLRKGALTEVEVVELQERSIPEGVFSLDDPAARRALEPSAPPAR